MGWNLEGTQWEERACSTVSGAPAGKTQRLGAASSGGALAHVPDSGAGSSRYLGHVTPLYGLVSSLESGLRSLRVVAQALPHESAIR